MHVSANRNLNQENLDQEHEFCSVVKSSNRSMGDARFPSIL